MHCSVILRIPSIMILHGLVLLPPTHQVEAQNQEIPPSVVVAEQPLAPPPSDAIILFDGKDVSSWIHRNGDTVRWPVVDGTLICEPGSGSISTREMFGDAQIHLEFATASMPESEGQGRSNSGIYMQGRYEVQILDSYDSSTYVDGQCGAIYGQYPPLVNVCRPPDQWQTFDIIFNAPRFSDEGERIQPGTLTVFHNGVLIHDHAELQGSTTASMLKEDPDPGPLYLQDHGSRVKFRNIWIRQLNDLPIEQDRAP